MNGNEVLITILVFMALLLVWFVFSWILKLNTCIRIPTIILIIIIVGLQIIIKQPIEQLKIGLFIGCLCFVFIYDLKTKTIPRFIHYFIVSIGLIDINTTWLLGQAIGGLVILPIPLLIVYYGNKKNGIGLGDIKLVGSTGFVIGLYGGFIGLLCSLSAGVVYCLITKEKRSIPLAPFLTQGVFIVYCINFIHTYNFLQ